MSLKPILNQDGNRVTDHNGALLWWSDDLGMVLAQHGIVAQRPDDPCQCFVDGMPLSGMVQRAQ